MRDRVLSLLKRFGWNATAFQTLGEGFDYWFDGDDACVAYCDTGRGWVAAGSPLCSNERIAEVSKKFVDAARAKGHRVCFFGVEDRFVLATGYEPMPVGEQPVWNPRDWATTVRNAKSLKEQLRRATSHGVKTRLFEPTRDAAAVAALRARSQSNRPMAPMGFLVSPADDAWAAERLSWVAEHDNRLVGFVAAAPIYARAGWLIEEFLRDPAAPNGTIELLIDTAMKRFADDGQGYCTLGLAPLAGDIEPWLRTIAQLGSGLYDFGGLQRFKSRLKPQRWDTISVAVPDGGSLVLALFDTLRAFARGNLLRFGLETLLRVPDVVVRLLGVMLVPWTIALAFTDELHWFPRPWVHHAWVGFDVALAVAILLLARTWRRRLAFAVCIAVTLDAIVTTAEAALFNLHHLNGFSDAVAVAIACAAPAAASVLLWRAWLFRGGVSVTGAAVEPRPTRG